MKADEAKKIDAATTDEAVSQARLLGQLKLPESTLTAQSKP